MAESVLGVSIEYRWMVRVCVHQRILDQTSGIGKGREMGKGSADAGEFNRLWLSAPDEDGEREFWFDPDEGGAEYVLASSVTEAPSEGVLLTQQDVARLLEQPGWKIRSELKQRMAALEGALPTSTDKEE